MDFIITAYDYKNQVEKRITNRDAHIQGLSKAAKQGNLVSAAALLNDEGDMVGSSVHVRFESKTALDKWLKDEPYIVNQVWESFEIQQAKILDVDALKSS